MDGVYFVQYEHRLTPGYSILALGHFTTYEKAASHVAHSRTQPGFSNAPGRFSIEFWALDRTVWQMGFTFGEHGPDIPFWAARLQPLEGERAKAYAKRLCDPRFGRRAYQMGPSSEYAQLKKRVAASRPGVESNRTLEPPANRNRASFAPVWVLSHEHERRDAKGLVSDEAKSLGFFTSRQKARDAMRALATKSGFRATPDGFSCERSSLDSPQWCEGFVTCTHGPVGELDLPAWFQGCAPCMLERKKAVAYR